MAMACVLHSVRAHAQLRAILNFAGLTHPSPCILLLAGLSSLRNDHGNKCQNWTLGAGKRSWWGEKNMSFEGCLKLWPWKTVISTLKNISWSWKPRENREIFFTTFGVVVGMNRRSRIFTVVVNFEKENIAVLWKSVKVHEFSHAHGFTYTSCSVRAGLSHRPGTRWPPN